MKSRPGVFFLLIAAAAMNLSFPAFSLGDQEEKALEDSFKAFSSMLHAKGLGEIRLEDRKEEVFSKLLRDNRFERVSRINWDRAPSNEIVLGQYRFMIYWGFKNDRLQNITIHLPSQAQLSSQRQIYTTRGLAKKMMEGIFGPPTQSDPIDILEIPSGAGTCTERWVLPNWVEINIAVFRHEPFCRVYSVGIQLQNPHLR